MTQEKPSEKLEKNDHWRGPEVSGIVLDPQHTTLVDTSLLDSLLKFQWTAIKSNKCWYAKAIVGPSDARVYLAMHRMIAHSPSGQICHHRNRNSLDNRFDNLLNMNKFDHQAMHRDNHALIKFKDNLRQHPEFSL